MRAKEFIKESSEEERNNAFAKLADDQRGLPERAMLKVQYANGGGVLNFVVEHVGDITHRMTEMFEFLKGNIENVGDKVEKTLRTLRYGYGFEREHIGNMKNNADYDSISFEEQKEKVDNALKIYATEHRKLKVYNEPQKWARDAAVALGEQQWKVAIINLERLEELLKDSDEYVKAVSKYTTNEFINEATELLYAYWFNPKTSEILEGGMSHAAIILNNWEKLNLGDLKYEEEYIENDVMNLGWVRVRGYDRGYGKQLAIEGNDFIGLRKAVKNAMEIGKIEEKTLCIVDFVKLKMIEMKHYYVFDIKSFSLTGWEEAEDFIKGKIR